MLLAGAVIPLISAQLASFPLLYCSHGRNIAQSAHTHLSRRWALRPPHTSSAVGSPLSSTLPLYVPLIDRFSATKKAPDFAVSCSVQCRHGLLPRYPLASLQPFQALLPDCGNSVQLRPQSSLPGILPWLLVFKLHSFSFRTVRRPHRAYTLAYFARHRMQLAFRRHLTPQIACTCAA